MLHITTQHELNSFIKPRKGEVKLGEVVSVIKNQEDYLEELKRSPYKYVLFGIPEDIGVRMNR
ncbi:hypothetical protein [Balneicella halophila]|uniref:hypothetical protein n=1 Tax=Balneicella halophila TaxID=1537566 RepID=UPI000E3023AA|nr:hypothetical protein [Balneicella halophila]